jgi:hypothetical protein
VTLGMLFLNQFSDFAAQEYASAVGCSEFQSRLPTDGMLVPTVWSRRLPCRCRPCRSVMRRVLRPHIDSDDDDGEDTTCVAISMMPVSIVGNFQDTKFTTGQHGACKTQTTRKARMAKNAEKVHVLDAAAARSASTRKAPQTHLQQRARAESTTARLMDQMSWLLRRVVVLRTHLPWLGAVAKQTVYFS